MQVQQGCDDCGLFLIAFATSLVLSHEEESFEKLYIAAGISNTNDMIPWIQSEALAHHFGHRLENKKECK